MVACNKGNHEVKTLTPTPPPTPTPELKYDISGTAFLKLAEGSDLLAGMKIQLVDGENFPQSFRNSWKAGQNVYFVLKYQIH